MVEAITEVDFRQLLKAQGWVGQNNLVENTAKGVAKLHGLHCHKGWCSTIHHVRPAVIIDPSRLMLPLVANAGGDVAG